MRADMVQGDTLEFSKGCTPLLGRSRVARVAYGPGATHSGAQGQHHHVALAFGDTVFNFTQHRGVGVVDHAAVTAEKVREVVADQAFEFAGQVLDAAAIAGGQSRTGNADGLDDDPMLLLPALNQLLDGGGLHLARR